MPVEQQIIILYAAINGYLDDVPVEKLKDFETGLLEFFTGQGQAVLKQIVEKKEITDEIDNQIKKTIGDYKQTVDYLIKEETKNN